MGQDSPVKWIAGIVGHGGERIVRAAKVIVNQQGRCMVYKWIKRAQVSGRPNGVCPLCGDNAAGSKELCPGCDDDLPWNHQPCPRCALPLPAGTGSLTRCAGCQRHPPAFDAAWSPLRYVEPVRWLHRRFKFHEKMACGRLLGELMAEACVRREPGDLPQRIAVVPLHPARLRERGFNQALELARPLSRRLGIPLDAALFARIRATEAQSDLPALRRHANIRGAFACHDDLRDEHIAIFDDVMTTGHTANELAAVARRAGAARIEIWTVARA
jgi:ComF family protein